MRKRRVTPDDLDNIKYLPSIRSRQAELRGYRELRAATKGALIPIVSLGKLGRVADTDRIMQSIAEAVSGRFFLDINSFSGQTCADHDSLCNPDDAFKNWRELAVRHPNAIPIALLRESAAERPFIQQVRRIERDYGIVVIRSRRPTQDLSSIEAALSAVDDVNNVLVVLDFGYIRGSLEARENEALRIITALRTIDSAARIISMASSFPKAVSAYGDTRGSLEIIERDFHWHIGGDAVAGYGDHAAVYPVPFEPQISRFVPRIDYCLDHRWQYERRREDDGGYVACANATIALPDWDADFARRSWGASVISETAIAGRVPPGFGSPSNWIAARINMHIERQVALAARPIVDDEDGDVGEF